MAEQNVAIESAERQELRKRYGLRRVTDKEEGYHISLTPAGVYGFTTSPATDELPLFTEPIFRSFEIFKLQSKEVLFVGYGTKADAEAVENGSDSYSFDYYPEPYEQSTSLIVVPLSRLDRRKPPTRDHGNAMRVEVAPRAEHRPAGVN